jgi:hypothetical protein
MEKQTFDNIESNKKIAQLATQVTNFQTCIDNLHR